MLRRKIGGYEVAVECGDDLRPQAEGLLTKLSELNERGPALRDGTVIDFGWTPITLRAEGQTLVVCEPDFDGDPARDFAPTVDKTLRVLKWQIGLLNAIGAEGVPARFADKVVIAKGCLSLFRVYLERIEVTREADSGWYVGDPDRPDARESVSELEGVYVFQLLKARPALMKVLALPPGYLVVMEGDEPESIFDSEGVDRWAV